MPVAVSYDSTDNLLDPTEGVRLTASATPYAGFLGSDPSIFVAKAQGSTYYAFDDEAKYIFAGRVGSGSLVGPGLERDPGQLIRFYRWRRRLGARFPYRTLGPGSHAMRSAVAPVGRLGRGPDQGHRHHRRGTLLRQGKAFARASRFQGAIRNAAGIGLRYYTGIGPIRVDVAIPFERISGENAVALYISMGQAF